MKLIAILFTCVAFIGFGQTNRDFKLDQTKPENLIEALRYCVESYDYNILRYLCDPHAENDGDTQQICDLYYVQKEVEQFKQEWQIEKLEEFHKVFNNVRVLEAPKYMVRDGVNRAAVKISFTRKNENAETFEIMNMVQRYGYWYISDF